MNDVLLESDADMGTLFPRQNGTLCTMKMQELTLAVYGRSRSENAMCSKSP